MHSLRTLRWLYLGRLTLAAGIFGGALLVWPRTTPLTTLVATLVLLLSIVVTLGSLWHTQLRGRLPGRNFLYLQVIFDTLVVTAVVHITGGARSEFPPLYILVIAAGALLLPLPGGMLIGGLAGILYVADIAWLQPDPATGSVLLQLALFAAMALVTAALGDRLRRTGTALGAVESELEQLRLDTSDILQAIDTGLVTVDADGRLVYLNEAGERLLGIRERTWRGVRVVDELDRAAPGLGGAVSYTATRRTPIHQYEIRMPVTAEAGPRVVGARTTILEREGVPWVTAVFQDITEDKRLEELARRAERLQAVAELGASLAHEIRNPLASIRSAVEQLGGNRLQERDRGTLRGLVLTESDRLSRLLTEFMDFSRLELRRRGGVDLAALARQAIELVERHPDSDSVRLEYAAGAGALRVEGDEDLLHRAIFNLVLNGAQQAGQGGVVRVELDAPAPSELPAGVVLAEPVRVVVSDSGPGVAIEDSTRIFDPFFTTRKGGTGLGLALVHRAVVAHGGAIFVESGRERGAQFTVYLPGQGRAGVREEPAGVPAAAGVPR